MEAPSVLLFAFLIDILIGDPQYRWHPVRIIGRAIISSLNLFKKRGFMGTGAGVVLAVEVILSAVIVYAFMHFTLLRIHPLFSLSFDVFVCYSGLALKDLFNHITPVIKALELDDLNKARMDIGMVVGRDVASLDISGVTRAAIETLAENFVDGFLSPVFWYVIGCLAATLIGLEPVFVGMLLMIIFKAASTLDSMVGYKNEEFIKIGWLGARLDDVMNYIPARLSLIILFLGSWFSRFHSIDGLRVSFRDRLKHDSPNSAHAESFIAGALNIRLGGPTKYLEEIKDKPWLGGEYADPDVRHIMMNIGLIKISSWIAIIIACVIVFS